MIESEMPSFYDESDKQIEDVIDARKKAGEYDIISLQPNINTCRYAYSAPATGIIDYENVHHDDTVWMSSGEMNNNYFFNRDTFNNIGPTDSEITVVRVKREGLQFKISQNNWDMHDEAIPGDGTHLGESPSLVNLVTLVRQSASTSTVDRSEYLVPLSSWDPCDKPRELASIESRLEADCSAIHHINGPHNSEFILENNSVTSILDKLRSIKISGKDKTDFQIIKAPIQSTTNSKSLAGRILTFARKYFKKKTMAEDAETISASNAESEVNVSPSETETEQQ